MTRDRPCGLPVRRVARPDHRELPASQLADLLADDDVTCLGAHGQIEQLHELLARIEGRHEATHLPGSWNSGLSRRRSCLR